MDQPIEKPNDDQLIKYMLEQLGKPGWLPEDLAFLIQHPEFEHRPVSVREFITSEQYLNAKEDCWPEVLADLEDIFDQPLESRRFSKYSEIVRKMGIGSGKSFRVVYMFCYVAYRLGCYKDPQSVYDDIARGSKIALVNAAVTAPQAKKIIFGDISERIKNSPWFQKYMQPDPNVQSELKLPKNIVIFPGSSSEIAPLGYNIFMQNLDEAAFLLVTDHRDAAQDIYDAGIKRRKSRFGDFGLNAAISSPSYIDSFIERKMNDALSNKNISAKEGPTWENKPRDVEAIARGDYFEVQHPRTREMVKIPNLYKEDFTKNPKKAWRDFGAVASLALDPYFSDDEIARFEQIMARGQYVKKAVEARLVRGAVYNIHIDLGVTRDACGFAMGHYENDRLMVDLVLRIVSERRALQLMQKGDPYDVVLGTEQIDFDAVRGIVRELIQAGFAIGLVSFDQFQSVDSRQQLERDGIPTALVSVDKDTSAYDTLKSLNNTNRLEIVKHDYLLVEAKRLELKNGKKIDHPPKGSKDLMDAVAGVAKTVMEGFDAEDNYEESYVEESSDESEVTSQI